MNNFAPALYNGASSAELTFQVMASIKKAGMEMDRPRKGRYYY